MDEYIIAYQNDTQYQKYLQRYFGMVKCIDDNMGQLLDFLDNEGLSDDKNCNVVGFVY